MAEAKRDEVPLPEPIDAQWRRHRYTEDQLREYGRQCVQAEREATREMLRSELEFSRAKAAGIANGNPRYDYYVDCIRMIFGNLE